VRAFFRKKDGVHFSAFGKKNKPVVSEEDDFVEDYDGEDDFDDDLY
jgi:hypothetical protein